MKIRKKTLMQFILSFIVIILMIVVVYMMVDRIAFFKANQSANSKLNVKIDSE